MIKCNNCGNIPQENDKIIWKCNFCGKIYRAKLSFLQKIWSNKSHNTSKSIINCKQCSNLLDDGNEKIIWECSCGNEITGKLEDFIEKTVEQSNNTSLVINPKDKFCSVCGKKLLKNENYCSNCGTSKYGESKSNFCIECGTKITGEKKFCPNCGYKIPTESGVGLSFNSMIPTINKNKKRLSVRAIIRICAMIAIICGLGFLAKTYIPKLLITTEELLEDGKYEEAYSKANSDEKDAVLAENLVAYECQEVIDSFKNPSSFQLKNVWFKKGENNFVMSVSGENGFGGSTSSYILFYFDKNEYKIFASVDVMDNEKVYTFDDTESRLDKIINNGAREVIRGVINNYNKLERSAIKNINNLHKKDSLQDVKLLDNVKQLYPKGDSDEV